MANEANTLVAAMESGDVLAEAELRYRVIASMLDPDREIRANDRALTGTEVKALSIEADRLIHKIVSLRAEQQSATRETKERSRSVDADKLGKVVAFDADRFRKSG